MKNLFNDISQEEKNRILEMHSGKKNVISEQVLSTNTPQTKPNPLSKPTPKPTPKPIIGKTVNFYRDKGETKLLKALKIIKVVEEGDIIKFPLAPSKNPVLKGSTRFLEFKCGTPEPVVYLKGTNPPNFKQTVLTPMPLFNLEFLRTLNDTYCTVSRGGTWVPKADFAMNNQQDDTSSRIA